MVYVKVSKSTRVESTTSSDTHISIFHIGFNNSISNIHTPKNSFTASYYILLHYIYKIYLRTINFCLLLIFRLHSIHSIVF